jgi:hypothetical protein
MLDDLWKGNYRCTNFQPERKQRQSSAVLEWHEQFQIHNSSTWNIPDMSLWQSWSSMLLHWSSIKIHNPRFMLPFCNSQIQKTKTLCHQTQSYIIWSSSSSSSSYGRIESSHGGILKSSSSCCRSVTPKSKKQKPYIIKHDLTIALLNSKSKEEKKPCVTWSYNSWSLSLDLQAVTAKIEFTIVGFPEVFQACIVVLNSKSKKQKSYIIKRNLTIGWSSSSSSSYGRIWEFTWWNS